MKVLSVLLGLTLVIVVAASDPSLLKLKDGFESVYSYSHSRVALTPQKNITESCSCKIHLQPSTSNELLVVFKDAVQSYEIVPFKENEERQLDAPFIVRLSNAGEINMIVTEPEESIRSLTIKHQVMSLLLPNLKVNYQQLLKSNQSNFISILDLSSLPFGRCNATGQTTKVDNSKVVSVQALPRDCELVNLGGGKLVTRQPEDCRFIVDSTFDENSLELLKRKQLSNITMESGDGQTQAKIGYTFLADFLEFKEKLNWTMNNVTEEHNLEELKDLLLY